MVISKSENPRCFKNLTKDRIPVYWKVNKKAWMTSTTSALPHLDNGEKQDVKLNCRKLMLQHLIVYMDNCRKV
ncbi:hypothetical protein J437_LFUL013583 [Ladona fulva]|uniref:DDE-1 domain-containing protein n=1 Tax=Ladona fulva TaxID=123851 RepID=A0A8K0P436_LADFU|nr:hypothetical protein J437_LFUL013583 [Ladona fulva]